MTIKNETSIQFLIARYQEKIFAFAYYMMGGDRNAAYEITTSGFVSALQASPQLEDENTFLIRVASAVLEKGRHAKPSMTIEDSDILDLPPEKKRILQITKMALLSLSFETKAVLLLRDQLHFPYKIIAAILHVHEKDVKMKTTNGRMELRNKIEEMIRGARH